MYEKEPSTIKEKYWIEIKWQIFSYNSCDRDRIRQKKVHESISTAEIDIETTECLKIRNYVLKMNLVFEEMIFTLIQMNCIRPENCIKKATFLSRFSNFT